VVAQPKASQPGALDTAAEQGHGLPGGRRGTVAVRALLLRLVVALDLLAAVARLPRRRGRRRRMCRAREIPVTPNLGNRCDGASAAPGSDASEVRAEREFGWDGWRGRGVHEEDRGARGGGRGAVGGRGGLRVARERGAEREQRREEREREVWEGAKIFSEPELGKTKMGTGRRILGSLLLEKEVFGSVTLRLYGT